MSDTNRIGCDGLRGYFILNSPQHWHQIASHIIIEKASGVSPVVHILLAKSDKDIHSLFNSFEKM